MRLEIDILEEEYNECKTQVDMIRQEGFLIESLNTALKIHVANGKPLKEGAWKEVYAETDYRNGWIEFSREACEYQHGIESGEYGKKMTRDEAIKHGKEQLEVFGGEHKEFIRMAIRSLEAWGNCRQALEEYEEYVFHNSDNKSAYAGIRNTVDIFMEHLKEVEDDK